MSQEKHNLYMKMDKKLHEKLKQVAKDNHRSLSAQMHVMLNDQLDKMGYKDK